jgi:hypothetical protein
VVSAPAPRRPAGEACELCGAPAPEPHRHVVDLEGRRLLCACTPCALLFTREGAGQGRYRAVPDRWLALPAFAVSPALWDELQVPVGLAFFFRSSRLARTVACYPGPAGATESELSLDAWDAVLAADPEVAGLAPDVEAVVVARDLAGAGAEAPEAYVVPIDACYALVGRLRLLWRGFDGGTEAHRAVVDFLADVRRRSGRHG